MASFSTLLGVTASSGHAQSGGFVEGLTAWQNGEAEAAFALWSPLAEQNDPEAQYGLGLLLEAGGPGVPANPALAATWYGRAAEGGIVEARTNLGLLFAQGKGVEQSNSRAAELWTVAARDGHNMAQFNLGLARYSGSGIAQNLPEAIGLIYAAAAADLPEAQFALGQFFRLGLGLEASETEAYFWFNRALALGNENAKPFVDEFLGIGLSLPDNADLDRQPALPETLAGSRGGALWQQTMVDVSPSTSPSQPAPDVAAALQNSLSPIPTAPSALTPPRSAGLLGPRVSVGREGASSSPPLGAPSRQIPQAVQPQQAAPPQVFDMSQFPPIPALVDIPRGQSQGLLWSAWLGTADSRPALEQLWLTIVPRQPDILTQVEPGVQSVRVSGKTRYRLLAGPFPGKSVAWQVCNAIKITNPDLFCKARVIE